MYENASVKYEHSMFLYKYSHFKFYLGILCRFTLQKMPCIFTTKTELFLNHRKLPTLKANAYKGGAQYIQFNFFPGED